MSETPVETIDVDNLIAAIKHRRSLGLARLQPREVDPKLIETILDAANWAPSHDETEPWRFTVFTGEGRSVLADAFEAAYREDYPGDRFQQGACDNYRERAWKAPVWIAIGVSPMVRPDGSLQTSEEEEALAVACAVQNLHLVASALGLAGMWNSKFPLTHPRVAEAAGLAASERLLGFVFLGWPAIAWPKGERRPLSEKVRWVSETPA